MAVYGAPESDEQEVRQALGRLCTKGLIPWWVRDQADVLLNLRCVVDRAQASEGRQDQVEALVEILRELIGRIRHQSHGEILWIVLGFETDCANMSVEERRKLAGEKFRDGMKPVKSSTIRQHHEKKALDRLTKMLLDYESRHIGKAPVRPTMSR
ncbi:MAG: hypothetical protein WAN93_01250 [Solirubrobacteraceae bacterium]